jgi:acyl-CoA synthetase (NDP forming)
MKVNSPAQSTQDTGVVTLSETESKKILKKYAIPVVTESVVATVSEAKKKAALMGYPVVIKGLGAKLTHKTELGLVKLNLNNKAEVGAACLAIKASAGADLEGYLLQPMLEGKREFVAGLFRDPQFGPVVMFGLGGVFTEALEDVVFRIAPFGEDDARAMLKELRAGKLLGDFRGESAADEDQLVQVLLGLAKLGIERPEVTEIDINPLLVSPKGKVTAVDALVVIEKPQKQTSINQGLVAAEIKKRVTAINAAMDVMCYPKSVAVVGVARAKAEQNRGLFGYLLAFGYPGRVYPINPKADEIGGLKAYPNLASLPEPVDLVIFSLPRQHVPAALKDCVAAGCKNVHIFTSGFKETAEPEGIRLHNEMEKIAREGGLNIIGPNCMGLYVPESLIVTWPGAAIKSGPVSFISQSGGHAQDFTNYTTSQLGLYFNKVVSFGNALNMDCTDFLAYLAQDEKTRIITMYLEGVKDGRRLFDLLKTTVPRKPVIVLKGGQTENGARAVASHTGSMAGGVKIWNALFKQTGVVSVASLEQMADVALGFARLPLPKGRRVAVIGTGGGIGVAAADDLSQAGLEMPPLTKAAMGQLREFIPPAGTMIKNPIDAHNLFLDLNLLGRTLSMLADEGRTDMFVISIHLDWFSGFAGKDHVNKIAAYIAESAQIHTGGRPLLVVWRQYQPNAQLKKSRQRFLEILQKGSVPAYEGLPRAAAVLAKLAQYSEFLKKGA